VTVIQAPPAEVAPVADEEARPAVSVKEEQGFMHALNPASTERELKPPPELTEIESATEVIALPPTETAGALLSTIPPPSRDSDEWVRGHAKYFAPASYSLASQGAARIPAPDLLFRVCTDPRRSLMEPPRCGADGARASDGFDTPWD
jgi:hypothetical protein